MSVQLGGVITLTMLLAFNNEQYPMNNLTTEFIYDRIG